MIRLLFFSLIAATTFAFAGPIANFRTVDLDEPGAVEALKHKKPEHFEKVRKILAQAPQLPLESIQGWIQTNVHATQVTYPTLIKTSFPPKAKLSFVIDNVRYTATVTLENFDAKAMPAVLP